jgi:hypothetical protein
MKGFLSELFQNSLYSQIFLFLWGSLGVILGSKLGLFTLPPSIDRKKIPVSFLSLLQIFALFVLATFFLGPVCQLLLRHCNSLFPTQSASFSPFSSAFQVFTTFLILIWFSFRFQKESLLFFFAPPIQARPSLMNNILVSLLGWLCIFPVVNFVHNLLTSAILYLFHLPELPDQVAVEFLKMSLSSTPAFFLALLMIIVLAPVTEELLFRGFLQNWLKKHLGRNPALFFSSLAFAFFHFSFLQGLNNIPIISTLFILGLALGFIYERQHSLSASILLHSFFNLASALNFAYLQGSP